MPQRERQLEWADYWNVVTRRRWILLAALFVSGLAATAAAALWPVRYQSQALILVEQQDVPSAYVRPNVTADARQRLATISQQVLSRTQLEGLIDRYHLYPQDAGPTNRDRRIERMRKNIALEPVQTAGGRSLTALKIKFTCDNPRTAQEVDNDLTSKFINQSLEARTQASAATTEFLKAQLAEAQKDLAVQQSRLSALKTRYLGELPEQEQGNIQILGSLQAQLYSETNARDNAEQQEIYLQSLASAYRRINAKEDASAGNTTGGPAPLAVIDKAIAGLQQKVTALAAQYTAHYPDLIQARDQLAKWQTMRKAAFSQSRKVTAAAPAAAAAAVAAGDPNMSQVQSRIKATRAEISMHGRQIARLKKQIADAETRLRFTPLRGEQLAAATRDYQNARDNYESLLQKKMQSELATNLEKREEGERLQVVDPASLPQKPVAPNRIEIVLAGWAVGLVAGVGVISAQEITDETLRNDSDLREQLPCPVLAHLPILLSAAGERRQKWLRIAEISALALLALASAGLGIYICMLG